MGSVTSFTAAPKDGYDLVQVTRFWGGICFTKLFSHVDLAVPLAVASFSGTLEGPVGTEGTLSC